MNELQLKLARRRNLNGESIPNESIPSQSQSVHTNTNIASDSYESKSDDGNLTELQKKLARRRNLNGENTDIKSTVADSSSPISLADNDTKAYLDTDPQSTETDTSDIPTNNFDQDPETSKEETQYESSYGDQADLNKADVVEIPSELCADMTNINLNISININNKLQTNSFGTEQQKTEETEKSIIDFNNEDEKAENLVEKIVVTNPTTQEIDESLKNMSETDNFMDQNTKDKSLSGAQQIESYQMPEQPDSSSDVSNQILEPKEPDDFEELRDFFGRESQFFLPGLDVDLDSFRSRKSDNNDKTNISFDIKGYLFLINF